MTVFFSGMLTMGYVVAGLFFIRFWRRADDGLFLAFGIAFWMFAISQFLLNSDTSATESKSWIFIVRASGFALLVLAIVAKNLQQARRRR